MAEPVNKEYPHKEDDISYEKEITDAIKKLPPAQRILAVALNHYTLAKKRLDAKIDEEIDKIVIKYNDLQLPVTDRCNELISGEKAPTVDEVNEFLPHFQDEEKAKIDTLLTKAPIDEYWFKVLSSCGRLSEDIFEVDHPLLKKLTKITHLPEANSDSDNFELVFHFAPNDYFENDVLKVKFFMLEDGQDPEKMESTEIKWKEGKDITKKKIQKKQKNKKTGKTRTVEKVVDADSFFNLFRTISGPAAGDDEDEEGGDENMERLNINTDIAITIQEEIIPYHLEYYLGLRKGDYDDMGGLGGDDGDDDDDDDDEDEKPARKDSGKGKGKRNSGNAGPGGAAAGKAGEKPECKQQ